MGENICKSFLIRELYPGYEKSIYGSIKRNLIEKWEDVLNRYFLQKDIQRADNSMEKKLNKMAQKISH